MLGLPFKATVKKGKAVIAFTKLPKGKHKLTATFAATTELTAKSAKAVTLTVK
jgi:hypothetical protein